MNLLEILLVNYPNENWDFDDLIVNKNISVEFVFKNPKFNWNYYTLHENPNFLKYYINNENNYFNISKNIDLNEFNLRNLGNNINWNGISLNKNLDENFVEKYKDNINFDSICKNKNISFDYLIKNIDKIKLVYNITNNPNLTINDYEKYKNIYLFNNYELVRHANFNINYILSNLNIINKYTFSLNPNMNLNFVEKYIDIIDHYSIFQNESIDTIDILNLIIIVENYYKIKDKKINYEKIFKNISLNPNLNYWFIKKYKKYINFKYLSFNKFELDSYYYYKNRKEGV
jgi:hypothetical protein